nr:unnamed protein product [Digitaria exilis]
MVCDVKGAGARELQHARDRCPLVLPHPRVGRRSSPPPALHLTPGQLASVVPAAAASDAPAWLSFRLSPAMLR